MLSCVPVLLGVKSELALPLGGLHLSAVTRVICTREQGPLGGLQLPTFLTPFLE